MYLEVAVSQTRIGLGQIALLLSGAVSEILGPDEHNLLVTAPDQRIIIVEQPPTDGVLQVTQRFPVIEFGALVVPCHVVVIVVIAQYRENAVARMQPRQQVAVGQGFDGLAAHKVAGETDHVGIERVDGVDLLLDDGRAAVVGAQVGVAPLYDAVAVEGLGEPVKFQHHFLYL